MRDGRGCGRPRVFLPVQMMCCIPGSSLTLLMSTDQNVSPHLTVYCYDRAPERRRRGAPPSPDGLGPDRYPSL